MQTIYLDISNKGVISCIQAKQSEVGRKFLAVITDNGVPYNIPNDALLSVWYEGDTDAGNYSSIEERSAFSIDGNKVAVELVAQMLLKPGNGEMCLSISHGDGREINSWNIPYCVEYKPGAGSSVPTEYYTALTNAAALAAEQVGYANVAAERAAAAQTAAENAVNDANAAMQNALNKNGDTMAGELNMDGNILSGLPVPQNDAEAASKGYVDTEINATRPVGSVVISSTNENPAAVLGGTWELIDKGFRNEYVFYEEAEIPTDFFTPQAGSNTTAVNFQCTRSGATVRLRLGVTSEKTFTDNETVVLGNINFAAFGFTGLPMGYNYILATTDYANGALMLNVAYNTGAVSVNDVLNGSEISSIYNGKYYPYYFDMTFTITPNLMIDSFCDKFYWKRTA